MTHPSPSTASWDDLRVLLAVHRHQSHARAARALGIDATTIGRKLRALEGSLGVPLLRRGPGGYSLTPAATALIPGIERMEEDASSIERIARGADHRVEGTVRLTAGDGILNYVIVPALPALRARHRDLAVHLLGDVRVLDISKREADVAVRLVRPDAPNLIAKRLPPLPMGIFASEAYLRSRSAPVSSRNLANQDWLDYEEGAAAYPQVRWMRRLVPSSRVTLRASTTTTLVRACEAGLGLAVLNVAVGEAQRLVRVLPQADVPQRDAWIVHHRDDRTNPRVRVLVDWLEGLFNPPGSMSA